MEPKSRHDGAGSGARSDGRRDARLWTCRYSRRRGRGAGGSLLGDHRSSAACFVGRPSLSETCHLMRVLYVASSAALMVTLEQMKGATDSSFLDGINQIVNQGYSYSPPQVGEPGWVFYASTMVNHNNIWWRHYKHLAAYIQRAAALLLKGVSINPIAVYVPLADIYAHYG